MSVYIRAFAPPSSWSGLRTPQTAACEDVPPSDGGGDRVAVDVIVDGDNATVFVRPLERNDCFCSLEPGLEGGCVVVFSDQLSCRCGPDFEEPMRGCVTDLRLETSLGGMAEVASEGGAVSGRIGADGELVITGCGETARVPLRNLQPPVAWGASDVRLIEPQRADALADVDGASHARICASTGFTRECCDAPPGRVEVPPPPRRPCGSPLTLEALAGPTTLEAAMGTVRVWSRAQTPLEGFVSVPAQRADGRFETRMCLAVSNAEIDIGGEPVDRLVFDADDLTRFTLAHESGTFSLQLGPTEDVLRFTTVAEQGYVSVISHEPVERELTLGSFEESALELAYADVVATNVLDANDTLIVALQISGTLPVIARP